LGYIDTTLAKQDLIRSKLDAKVFTPYGKDVVLNHITATTYNVRGEEENLLASTSSIKIVPYNITNNTIDQQAFGDLQRGVLDAAVPYNVTISVKDTILMDGITWSIVDLQENYLPGNVVTIIRMEKQQQ
jgi:hypothetical protein